MSTSSTTPARILSTRRAMVKTQTDTPKMMAAMADAILEKAPSISTERWSPPLPLPDI